MDDDSHVHPTSVAAPSSDHVPAMQSALSAPAIQHYALRLYVAGSTPQSARALGNIRRICEQHLAGRYELEVIDILQHPQLAQRERVIAAPTLIRMLPLPERRFIGCMSETERILVGLDIAPAGTAMEHPFHG